MGVGLNLGLLFGNILYIIPFYVKNLISDQFSLLLVCTIRPTFIKYKKGLIDLSVFVLLKDLIYSLITFSPINFSFLVFYLRLTYYFLKVFPNGPKG